MVNTSIQFFPKIQEYVESLKSSLTQLAPGRKERLQKIANYVRTQVANENTAEMVFICTHNSRRSQFGQIWAKVLADYYGISLVNAYSGGTEATAFHPNAIIALRTIGFQIDKEENTANPRYTIQYAKEINPIIAWSKVYSDSANPNQQFCAIMTCSEADEACPAVFGAGERVSLPFEDPKKADDTPQQSETYLKRCRQIATELTYVFQFIQS